MEMDLRDLQAALDRKKAAVASAEANVALLRARLDFFRSEIATAEATAKQTAAEAGASAATAESGGDAGFVLRVGPRWSF